MNKTKQMAKTAGSTAATVVTPETSSRDATKVMSLAEVIRATMVRLEDPMAKAKLVKEKALQWFPEMSEAINNQEHWSSYVSQAREPVADALGIRRRVEPESESDALTWLTLIWLSNSQSSTAAARMTNLKSK